MVDLTQQAERHTIQQLPDARESTGASAVFYAAPPGPYLPAWGTRARERALRQYYRHDRNWMAQSAFAGVAKKIASTPWELRGTRSVGYWHELLYHADFGAGWTTLITKIIIDYLRHDVGAFVEVIAPGRTDRPITQRVVGLAALDPLRCYPTGDPMYPVIYHTALGGYHTLHHSRVWRLYDMPDSDDQRPGYGLCALSRAIAIVVQQLRVTSYIDTRLDDVPPPGIMILRNISEQAFASALDLYSDEQQRDQQPVLGRMIRLPSIDPTAPAGVEQVAFAQAPDNWNYREYVELHANAIALALGVDVQEIWQLTGGNLGSAQQSEILHAKSQGRLIGSLLTQIERGLNAILPRHLTFELKRRDPYEVQERAQTARLWGDFVQTVSSTLTVDEARRILANMVEAYHDAVTDERGAVVRLHDADIADAEAGGAEPVPPAPAEQVSVEDNEQLAQRAKSIQATRLDFELAMEDLLAAARAKEIDRRRFIIILRSLLARYVQRAFADGLEAGGVLEPPDEDDRALIAAFVADHVQFVKNFADELYREGGISDRQAYWRPSMWWNKSVEPSYFAGLASADRNGMYEWVLGVREKHCKDCLRLNGQRHRMRDWRRRGLLPKVDILACRGFNCDCRLVRTPERARGRF